MLISYKLSFYQEIEKILKYELDLIKEVRSRKKNSESYDENDEIFNNFKDRIRRTYEKPKPPK